MDQSGIPKLEETINGLRLCNAAQSEVIANFEEYERVVMGTGNETETVATGYSGGYLAEIDYLHSRRVALDSLILAVEKYGELAKGLIEDELIGIKFAGGPD